MTDGYWKRTYNNILRAIQVFLLLTFLVVVIVTLTECHPFTHYWQVTPDPGPGCRQNYAQLVTMGVADIVTDVLLIVFPIPAIVFKSTLTVRRKISLVLLFCLSGFLIAITAIRVPAVIQKNGSQQYRSLWASCEILAAAAVSNALVLGSFVRDRGVKKNKYKFGSVGADSLERTPTRWQSVAFAQRRMLGSDGDLLHGTGYRLAAEPKADDSEKVMTKPAAAVTHPPLVGGRTRPSSRGYNFSRPRGLKRDRSISKRRSGATEDHEELYPKRLPAVPFGDEKVPMSPSTVGNDEPMALQTAHYPSTNAAQTEDALAEADLKAATQHEARHD